MIKNVQDLGKICVKEWLQSYELLCCLGCYLILSRIYVVRLLSNFIQQETATQEFSIKFCEILKNTYSLEHLRPAASEVTTKQV